MNKVFKVIWDSKQQCCIVVSELAKNNSSLISTSVDNSRRPRHTGIDQKKWFSNLKQANLLSLIATSIFLLSPSQVTAAVTAEIPVYEPDRNSHEQGQLIIGNGEVVNLITGTKGFGNIATGAPGYKIMTIQDAEKNGYVTSGNENIDAIEVNIGGHTQTIQYTDSVTGAVQTMQVYDNNNFSSQPVSSLTTYLNVAVGNQQYVDMKLATVNAGGILNVDIGSKDSGWTTNNQNNFNAITKTSNIFNVETQSSDTDKAVLNYDSKTIVRSGNAQNVASPGGQNYNFNVAKFAGTFNSAIGSYTVNSLNDLKSYNAALIDAISKGLLSPEQYDSEFTKAYSAENKTIHFETHIPVKDPVFELANRDVNSFIRATGAHSEVNIAEDANIQAVFSDTSVVTLTQGATLNNKGTLGVANGYFGGDYVISAHDSTINNEGIIDAGTSKDIENAHLGAHTAIFATGSTHINNTGVINLASHQNNYNAWGVSLNNTAVFDNAVNGVMNIATGGEPSQSQDNLYTYGIFVQEAATANNAGNIYIGRTAQSAIGEITNNIDIKLPAIGMFINSGTINNNGTVTIGENAENAIAIKADGQFSPNNITVNQNGIIDINGTKTAQNIGILSDNGATGVLNRGTINLNGFSAVGIKLLNGSKAENTGEINITNGNNSSTLKNFGTWIEGKGSHIQLSGKINLGADNAIGLHVRDGGTTDITKSGQIVFNAGKNQIGYFIYGAGSSINNASSIQQDVSNNNSTLYRIEGGAIFNGNSSNASLKASGTDSTIIQVTGEGSQFSSSSQSFEIAGDGATGIRVEGGASGEITADAVIVKVIGKNTTAGIVDGNYYDLNGNIDTSKKGNSQLTSHAILSTTDTASGAFGYITRNSGILNHKGKINFDHTGSTGVLVSGGTLNNEGDITVNGTAINIQGADSVVNNYSTVNAIDGTAAYLIGKDASLNLNGNGVTTASGNAHAILLDDGAMGLTVDGTTITMSATSNGNAIENKAGIAGIQLSDTTINVGNGIGVHSGASMAQTNTGTINVVGNGTGILFENIDGSQTIQSLDMSNSKNLVINVTQAGGRGIVTNTSADLKTGASVNILDENGGAALIVKGSTQHVEQSGELTSLSIISPVVDINNGSVHSFINYGTINAIDKEHTALAYSNGNGVHFTNTTGAAIRGKVDLLSGNNTVILESGSTGDDFTTGHGNDIFLLKNIKENETSLFSSLNGNKGNDKLYLENSVYTIDHPDNVTGIEHIALNHGSTLTLDHVLFALGDDKNDTSGTGYNIDQTSVLSVKSDTDVIFNSHLAGTGLVSIDANSNHINFTGNNAGDGFGGTVALSNSRFELASLNTQTLNNATLSLGNGNITHVGSGQQNIGGLVFNGGTASFNGVTPGKLSADGIIHSSSMNLLGQGTIQIDTGVVSNDIPQPNNHFSILEQDDGQKIITLATSDTTVSGNAGNLSLTDKNGNIISNATEAEVSQNGQSVAKGTYDYRLTSGNKNDGLYISYGLTQLELQGKGNDALILDAAGKNGNAVDLSARISGNGDLALNSQKGQTITLSNMNNDYLGTTDIRSGNLLMLNSNVLGKTSELTLSTDTILDMNGHSQTIGQLNGSVNSVVNINGGTLTLTHGGISSGTLVGGGALNIAGDNFTVNGANTALEAATTITSDAQVRLNDTSGLGTGDIIAAGKLILSSSKGILHNNLSDNGSVILSTTDAILAGNNTGFNGQFDIDGASRLTALQSGSLGNAAIHNLGELMIDGTTDWTMNNLLSGDGSLIKQGTGSITLTSNATYTGKTDIFNGALILGEEDTPVILNSKQINIASDGILSGFGGTQGNISNHGLLLLGNGTVSPAQTFTVGGNLTNSGQINLGTTTQKTAGNQLIVNGNYHGDGGLLHFNTVLGNDDSVTNKLTVKGDTTGTSRVRVSNAGGTGAQTLDGIELIHINGNSSGEFYQEGRITAGAYDYSLIRGQGNKGNNWYLTSHKTNPHPEQKPNPEPDLRPEGGSYTANLTAANTLFNTRLHDRLGETQYIDVLTGEKHVTSMWMRQTGRHNNWRDSSSQLKSQSNRYIIQLGGDVAQWSSNGFDRWHLGIMAGYGHENNHTSSSVTGYSSKGSVNGYSVGTYATWYANDTKHNGLYIDSWLQYNWFNNNVNGESLTSESYRSSGLTTSIETGYTYKLTESANRDGAYNEWFIQPQAQIILMNVKTDNHQESNGTRVEGKGDGNIQTRLGIKSYLKGHSRMDDGKNREFQPFIEANWIHNTRNFSTEMDGVNITQEGAQNIGEIRVGIEGQINPQLNLWGNVGVQVGNNGYNDSAAMLGIKYNF